MTHISRPVGGAAVALATVFYTLFVGLIALPASGASGASPAVPDGFWPPAWDTGAAAGKADQHTDFRLAHPGWFGITSPASVGIRPHAEFEPVQRVVIRPTRHIGDYHRDLIRALRQHVPTVVLLHSEGHDVLMKEALGKLDIPLDGLEFVLVDTTDSVWARDYGPISVVSDENQVGFVDFRYYHQRHFDDAIPQKLGSFLDVTVYRPSLSFEGGNFMADGFGTCYATEKLYTQNPGFSHEVIDRLMQDYMGCRQMVIVRRPENLGTGHIDMFCKLVSDHQVVVGYYDPALRPANAGILDEIAGHLAGIVPMSGIPLEVHRTPLPWDETEVWYTYTNALMANDLLLVPVFAGHADLEAEALAVYRQVLPDHTIQTVFSEGIIPSGGAVHCVTMEIPEGDLSPLEPGPHTLCPHNDITLCDEAGDICAGVPLEGRCDGDQLLTCSDRGYPMLRTCPDCCGFLPEGLGGDGWYDCMEGLVCLGCRNECAPGTSGCSHTGTHTWRCGSTEGTPCRVREYLPCSEKTRCSPDSGNCVAVVVPECPSGSPESAASPCLSVGQRSCALEGDAVIVCSADENGCLAWGSPVVCQDNQICAAGICRTADPSWPDPSGEIEFDAGSARTTGCGHGTGPMPREALILLWLVCVLAVARVRHQTRRSPSPTTPRPRR
jgi:agmatine deiminase